MVKVWLSPEIEFCTKSKVNIVQWENDHTLFHAVYFSKSNMRHFNVHLYLLIQSNFISVHEIFQDRKSTARNR